MSLLPTYQRGGNAKLIVSGLANYLKRIGATPAVKSALGSGKSKIGFKGGLSPQMKQALSKFKTESMSQKKLRKLNELKTNPKLGKQFDEGGDILRMGGQVSAIRSDWVKHK